MVEAGEQRSTVRIGETIRVPFYADWAGRLCLRASPDPATFIVDRLDTDFSVSTTLIKDVAFDPTAPYP